MASRKQLGVGCKGDTSIRLKLVRLGNIIVIHKEDVLATGTFSYIKINK